MVDSSASQPYQSGKSNFRFLRNSDFRNRYELRDLRHEDPAMLATTIATLGISFAVGKTLAAIRLGLFGGGITALLGKRPWAQSALRDKALVRNLEQVSRADEIVWPSGVRRNIVATFGPSSSR